MTDPNEAAESGIETPSSEADSGAGVLAPVEVAEAPVAEEEGDLAGTPIDLGDDAPAEAPETEPTDEPTSNPDPETEGSEPEPEADEAPLPATAVIDAPPAPVEQADPLAIPPTINEHALESLRVTDSEVTITDVAGNPPELDGLFSAPNEAGLVQCRTRLLQHTSATVHNRAVSVLLLPAGAWVSKHAAADLVERIQAERA